MQKICLIVNKLFFPTDCFKINKFEKQKQGEIVTKFIMDMIKTSTLMKDNQTTTDYLNAGSGVLDVAGGNGWCSLGLALCGVKSTCLDSSPSVGCLPSRYRKFLRRAIEGKIELEKKILLKRIMIIKIAIIQITFVMYI